MPWAIPTIGTAKMWCWMFHDQYSVINDLLLRIGLIDTPLAWIAEPTLSMWAVVIADVWTTVPFMALMLLAALQMIPSDRERRRPQPAELLLLGPVILGRVASYVSLDWVLATLAAVAVVIARQPAALAGNRLPVRVVSAPVH